MQLVLAALLAAGLPSPAQQQRSASAVYRVFHSVTATGLFVLSEDGQVVDCDSTISSPLARGTAFAVDANGWLITARHVIDPEELAGDYCEFAAKFSVSRTDRLELDTDITDIVGHSWKTRAVITRPGDTDGVCGTKGPLHVERDTMWPVSIEKLDTIADLALIKLTSDGPVMTLAWGSMKKLPKYDPVYAFGFPTEYGLFMGTGLLINRCEYSVTTDVTSPGPHAQVTASLELLSRYILDAKPGMSGGPVIAQEKVVGVLVAAERLAAREDPEGILPPFETIDLGFTVPVDYVHAWYLWARGLSKVRPTIVCELSF